MSIKEKNSKLKFYWDYFVIAGIFLILHLFIQTDYWDDIVTCSALAKNNFDLIKYMNNVYHSWSSRILVQAVGIIIGYFPNILWKIMDVLFVLLLYHSINKIICFYTPLSNEGSAKKYSLFLALSFLCFPYCLMASAGWITTTTVYTWCFALSFYGISVLLSASKGNKLSFYNYLFFGLALLYAANFDIMSIVLLLIWIVLFLMSAKNKSFYILYVEGLFAILLNLILFLACPGNMNRMKYDGIYHGTSDFVELTFLGHLRIGINSTFYHFVSIPNAVLFLCCLVLVFCTLAKTKNTFLRLLSFVPFAIDLFWTGYMFVFYTLKNRQLTYIYPDDDFIVGSQPEQYCAMFSATMMILVILYLMAYLTDFSKLSLQLIWILILFGLLPQIAVGFTTTASASVIRTSSFFYFALILCCSILVRSCNLLKNRLCFILLSVTGSAGAIVSLLQTIRHIMVYG